MELGVGFNTSGIIRFPFEEVVYQNNNWNLIRVNKDDITTWIGIDDKAILLQEDIDNVIRRLLEIL